jgi:hypothetical protein
MIANYSTKNRTFYTNVRLARDAKAFEKKGDQPAATALLFFHTSKGQDADVPIDVWVRRGSDLASLLRKGDICTIHGRLEFKNDNQGQLRGVLYDAEVETLVNLKERGPLTTESTPAFE